MPLGNPTPGPNLAIEYQVSAIPWVTSSSGNGAVRISFPFVTRFVVVKNSSMIGGTTFNVGFTYNGVSNSGNSFPLAPSESFEGELRCTQMYLSGSGNYSYSIIAGLTTIPQQSFPLLSSSIGIPGVG